MVSLLKNFIVGIDVGNFNIKVVEAQKKSGKMEILNYAVARMPENAINDGKITDIQKVAATIGNMLTSNHIKTKQVVAIISSSALITREVNVPKMKETDLEKYIQLDAQQYFPVNLEEYVLDFKVLEEVTGKDDSEYIVLLAAIPQVIIKDYIKIFDMLKLDLVAIDIEPNVISKYLNNHLNSGKEKNSTVAVIDFGAQNTNVNIFSKGVLKFSRMIPHGGNDITRSIADAFNLKFNEAEDYKIKNAEVTLEAYGAESLSKNIGETIKPVLDSIASDINKLFEFYNSRNTQSKVDSLLLVGGGSLLKGLDSYYRSVFSIPVRKVGLSDSITNSLQKSTIQKDIGIILNAFAATYRECD